MINKVCATEELLFKLFSKFNVRNFARRIKIFAPVIRITVLFSDTSVTLTS